ncbi:MHS family proline/betaine transporter-like MFS transporter [Streptomyces sp. SAI-135]|uniref:MFS transporter n=1 Tax=unclassified Streptomyces TaxID=2593676 RepID=UPI002473DA08|nr:MULTISPECIES: MFS transporter [unclassified Streptomyces]MDH6522819.1 MHS family proline/betaine transporter-like MFS transporter [Streptomyces sp. SAI-090]MDH6554440.1 MHS family proline/betaine transporter-like MFS transporter [Streptomyces sp. SAI-041]MDH6573706.1 MHS family proline/betaine transporter-like MFS transporter [Streptomyces sp. SAI-117]MDH6581562.1 MHS family proline/betaine transporter-like MFS transporter [Streptomyces sp. SAI-133]MDH6613566.1 MHS family proline/betaine tr
MKSAESPELLRTAPRSETRKVTTAGAIGFFVENYDNSVYGFLAGIIAIVFFPEGAESVALIFTFGLFAVSFVFRPVGGVLLGMMSDRVGRRPAMVLALTLMAGATTVIGLLPGYSSWGVGSVLLLLAMRMIQGISVGGEVSAAMSFVGEHAPPNRRAFLMSFPQAGSTLANLVGNGSAFLLTSTLSSAAMESWGWRIPFLIAAPMGVVGFYIRRRLEDTPAFLAIQEEGKIVRNPLRDVFTRDNRRQLALAFSLPMLNSAGFFVLFVFMPTYLSSQLDYTRPSGLVVSACALACATIAIPFFARISDRVGRRPVILTSCGAIIVLSVPIYLVLGIGELPLAGLAGGVIGIAFAGNYSVIHPMMLELFPSHMRTTAYSLGYNVTTAVLGGAAPLILSALYVSTGNVLLPAFFVALSAVGTAIAAYVNKETAGKSLTEFA